MKIEIILEKGQARLASPLYLKADAPHRFAIDIDSGFIDSSRDWMPDEINERGSAAEGRRPDAKPGSLQERFNEILGSYAHARAGGSIGDDDQTLLEAVEERYHG